MNADGDGCYFQDSKDDAVYMTYAAKNTMNFTIDELYNMALGMNGSPTLTTNIKTKNSYAIGWMGATSPGVLLNAGLLLSACVARLASRRSARRSEV